MFLLKVCVELKQLLSYQKKAHYHSAIKQNLIKRPFDAMILISSET